MKVWEYWSLHDAQGRAALRNLILHPQLFSLFILLLMSGSLLLHTMENPKCVSFFFCQWTKIKYAFMFHKRAKAKSNNPRDWNRFSVTWRTAKNLKASSDLVRSDKGREEEKLDPRLHTCTPCAWRANTGERLSRLWLDLSAQKHSVTHALASASVDRANTVRVTHTAAAGAKLAAAGHHGSPGAGSPAGHV